MAEAELLVSADPSLSSRRLRGNRCRRDGGPSLGGSNVRVVAGRDRVGVGFLAMSTENHGCLLCMKGNKGRGREEVRGGG